MYCFLHLPIEAFHNSNALEIGTPELNDTLNFIHQKYQAGSRHVCFATNIFGYSEEELYTYILLKLHLAVDKSCLRPHLIALGSIDAYVNNQLDIVAEAFQDFLHKYDEGISIELNAETTFSGWRREQ